MADEKLMDIVNRANRGQYYLPEIQRGFVWKPEQVRKLCDSLYKDYPTGMVLLWDSPEYVEPRIGAPNGLRQPLWIVDGQQRVTTLCLLFGQRPYWYGPEDWSQLVRKNRIFMNIDPNNGAVEFSGRGHGVGVSVPQVLSKERASRHH